MRAKRLSKDIPRKESKVLAERFEREIVQKLRTYVDQK